MPKRIKTNMGNVMDNKKYYYLKLKENFFDRPEIKAIEGIPNGYEYICIMQKMYLRSLERDGRLMLTDTIPYEVKTLSSVLGHRVEVINSAIDLFQQFGLLDILDDRTIYMSEIQNFIGQSSSEGDRKREFRHKIEQNKQNLIGGQMSDNRPREIEIEKELEIEIEKIPPTPRTRNKVSKPLFRTDSQPYILSNILYELIKQRNENHLPPDLQVWSSIADLMLKRDKRDFEEAKGLIVWVQAHSFWQNNILSMTKFREKYDQLIMQKRQNGTNQRGVQRGEFDKEKWNRLLDNPPE